MFGLILGGGDSKRMGQDKSLIEIQGKTLAEIQYENLGPQVQKTFFSGPEIKRPFILNIPDLLPGCGPLGGIYSAMKHYPDQAFFILPVDVLLENNDILLRLKAERDPSRKGTVVFNEDRDQAEPLIGIFEPACLDELEVAISSGKLGAADFVTSNNFKLVSSKQEWINLNTPEDLESVPPRQA